MPIVPKNRVVERENITKAETSGAALYKQPIWWKISGPITPSSTLFI